MVDSILDLPFRERPLRELLNLTEDRAAPDPDYVGFGWARAPRLWLSEPGARSSASRCAAVALHCPTTEARATAWSLRELAGEPR